MTGSGKKKQVIEGVFFFDPEDRIYIDHFPSNPVVPGALIIQAFLETASDSGYDIKNVLINNFKFKKFIPPGEYKFTMEKNAEKIKCILHDNSEQIAAGELII